MGESQEKAEEKQAEKDEKPQEKAASWQADPLSGTIWALVLIWAGLLLLGMQLNLALLERLNWGNVWGAILLGAGVLVGCEVLIRLAVPSYARPVRGRIILAAILVVIGLDQFIDVPLWPLIIIAIGLSMLFGAFRPRR